MTARAKWAGSTIPGRPETPERPVNDHPRRMQDMVRVVAVAHRGPCARLLTIRQHGGNDPFTVTWRWLLSLDSSARWYVQEHIYIMPNMQGFVTSKVGWPCGGLGEVEHTVNDWINKRKAEGFTVGRTIEKE